MSDPKTDETLYNAVEAKEPVRDNWKNAVQPAISGIGSVAGSQIVQNPVYAGAYVVGSGIGTIRFPLTVKPTSFHRLMSHLLLGWVWEDLSF